MTRLDDDFSQLNPDDDEFLDEIPDEDYIELDEDAPPAKPSLARPKFSALREPNNEKKTAETRSQESDTAEKIRESGVEESSPAEATAADVEESTEVESPHPQPLPVNEEGRSDNTVHEEGSNTDSPSLLAERGPGGEVELTYRYRIALVLSPEVEIQVNKLRQAVNLDDAEIGILGLVGDFRTNNLNDVQEILEEWVQDNLPMELTLDAIEAKTIGSQRYVAAWTLTPDEHLIQAQESLVDDLNSYITIQNPEASLPFKSRLVISDHTPAQTFPLLIREMQSSFEKLTWEVDCLEILRVPENDTRWEVLHKYM